MTKTARRYLARDNQAHELADDLRQEIAEREREQTEKPTH